MRLTLLFVILFHGSTWGAADRMQNAKAPNGRPRHKRHQR